MTPPITATTQRRPSERLRDAREFLAHAKVEIREGRTRADKKFIRQGSEKAFHALVEACAALAQKRGLGVPRNHDETRDRLVELHELHLRDAYDDAMGRLHVLTYYKGWVENERIDEQVRAVERAIDTIHRKLKG